MSEQNARLSGCVVDRFSEVVLRLGLSAVAFDLKCG